MELNIEELIKDQIAEIDIRSSVNSVVRQMVEPEVKQKIKKLTDKRVTEIIDHPVRIFTCHESPAYYLYQRYDI